MAFTKTLTTLAVIGMLACLPSVASAQDGAKKKHGRRHEALLKKFDKDGNGKLNKDERAAAREFLKSKRQEGGKEGRAGKHHRHRRVLHRFDKDHDGKLNDAEREALKKFRESHRGNRQAK